MPKLLNHLREKSITCHCESITRCKCKNIYNLLLISKYNYLPIWLLIKYKSITIFASEQEASSSGPICPQKNIIMVVVNIELKPLKIFYENFSWIEAKMNSIFRLTKGTAFLIKIIKSYLNPNSKNCFEILFNISIFGEVFLNCYFVLGRT